MNVLKKIKNTKYALGIFALGLIVGGAGIYLLTQESGSGAEISRLKVFSSSPADESILYTSELYGFSFRYPRGLIFKEFDEGGGSATIVFQKPGEEEVSFQIYITPYTQSTITGERILYDASGVVSDLKEENLNENLLVATFISEAPLIGKTREIWWLHNGHLFELTTYLSLDDWIREIAKTINFL